jgi:manganese oxidase
MNSYWKLTAAAAALLLSVQAEAAITCARTLTVDVIALDQPIMFNRLGAANVNGMMYALRRDVVNKSTQVPLTVNAAGAVPGQVMLRPDKRPRPLVLRVAAGDCLNVTLTNLLAPAANPNNAMPASAPPFRIKVDEQVADRHVGFHVTGMQLRNSIADDSSMVGRVVTDPGSLVPVGQSKVYRLFAEKEGVYVSQSLGAPFGSEATQGNSANGLHGQVIVEPKAAKIYRSVVTEEEMRLVSMDLAPASLTCGQPRRTAAGQPIVDYEARYPSANCANGVNLGAAVWAAEGKANLPILNMLNGAAIVHAEIDAIVAGPNADGSFPAATYPLESKGKRNPSVPNRLEAFRDFASVFHDEVATAQAFPGFFRDDPVFRYVLAGVGDIFMINYGSGGIGSEIIANRLGVGPMHDCLDCAYEEFFLTFHTVGEVGQVVDVPANFGLETLRPGQTPPAGTTGPKANFVLYPGDPSNVHHSYTNDFTKFRNTHIGKEQHVFHLHNHQWLFNAADDNSNYLDAQGIGPSSGFTYEINFGGSGNRNKTAGDAIFHCHFYPHFAMGMWYMWRNHDVFELGTKLHVSGAAFHNVRWGLKDGTPALGARALPDGEIVFGAPTPAVVPLPGKAMAVLPGRVTVKPNPFTTPTGRPVGSLANVIDRNINPGFPFWIAGMEHTVGQRPPTPVLDMVTPAQVNALKATKDPLWNNLDPAQAEGWDGGLPRHALYGVAAGGVAHTTTTPIDFSKEVLKARAQFFPEEGTDLEKTAMRFHALRNHPSFKVPLTGARTAVAANFVTNGSGGPAVGAPFHEPCIDDVGARLNTGVVGTFFSGESLNGLSTRGNSAFSAQNPRKYKGANIQFDVVLNKLGYHYPQQRIIALWEDAVPVINKQKPPEPLVMRLNTFDCALYSHSNLVPKDYEIDDYQVRTPTDIIGQHIHLPKWDLTTTDGSANGWNYEDGTLSPGMVVERIEAINCFNGFAASCKPGVTPGPVSGAAKLEPKAHPFFGQFGRPDWIGARTTMQRWFADPVVNTEGVDRGLGIIFTHDHYGPSTHQQIGLYATVLTEPAGSRWVHNETGVQLGAGPNGVGGRADGGPTSWQAVILPPTAPIVGSTVQSHTLEAFREFYHEFSDFQHAYEAGVYVGAGQDGRPLAGTGQDRAPVAFNAGNPQFTGNITDAFRFAINPPNRGQINPVFPDLVVERRGGIAPGCPTRPCPQAISVEDPGVMVTNYRMEAVGLRVFDPNRRGPDGKSGTQAAGQRGDLAFALQSRTDRAMNNLNVQPNAATVINGTRFPPPINAAGVTPGDPFTPMMRTYPGDLVRVKIQAGAHEEEHNASIHGMKWLQGGSGHGSSPNTGWRNSQAAGISEQFTLSTPVLPVEDSLRQPQIDYLYSMDYGNDGFWSGTWGILRSHENLAPSLVSLPKTQVPVVLTPATQAAFVGVCPANAPIRAFDVTAIPANRALPRNPNVTIQDLFRNGHVGGRPQANGGTLVYNHRTTTVGGQTVIDPQDGDAVVLPTHQGPLHDPTALLYVRTSDLMPVTQLSAAERLLYGIVSSTLTETLSSSTLTSSALTLDAAVTTGLDPEFSLDPSLTVDPTGVPATIDAATLAACANGGATNMACPVVLRPNAPIEPLVLRASAGDCITVTLRNRLTGNNPELATFTTIQGVVKRDRFNPEGSTTFQTNLIQSSSFIGLHPQLVQYDPSRADGTLVGLNRAGLRNALAGLTPPTRVETVRWYAGHIAATKVGGQYALTATPIEFGGVGLMPADKIKQGMKSLVGTLVIERQGASFAETNTNLDHQLGSGTRATRVMADVCPGGQVPCNGLTPGAYRSLSVVQTKAMSHYYRDSFPVEHINGEAIGIPEDSQDSTNMALNYGVEPLWFRFGLVPQTFFNNQPGGFGGVPNSHQSYSNILTANQDPATPVLLANAGKEARVHWVVPHGTTRGSTINIHGHVYQRQPYVCEGSQRDLLTGACTMTEVGSRNIGFSPYDFHQGANESVTPGAHWTWRLPSAGGGNAVVGDYLMRDNGGFGNTSGLWGILRVQ